ncbi:MAG: hypothetical protein MUP47_01920 [Phycisphaerae bacterium]|nr:hypothetical protein [Phycisphaerae bacterium]
MTSWPILANGIGIDVEDLIAYAVLIFFAVVVGLLKKAVGKSARPGQPRGEGIGAQRLPPGAPPQAPPAPPPRATGPMRVPGVRRLVGRRRAVPVPPEVEPASWDVAEEVRRQQERLARGQAERDQRLTALPPSEADTAAIEARLLHVRAAAEPGQVALAASLVGSLKTPDDLRRAILHYEIFAPPKALRPGPEPWEL